VPIHLLFVSFNAGTIAGASAHHAGVDVALETVGALGAVSRILAKARRAAGANTRAGRNARRRYRSTTVAGKVGFAHRFSRSKAHHHGAHHGTSSRVSVAGVATVKPLGAANRRFVARWRRRWGKWINRVAWSNTEARINHDSVAVVVIGHWLAGYRAAVATAHSALASWADDGRAHHATHLHRGARAHHSHILR